MLMRNVALALIPAGVVLAAVLLIGYQVSPLGRAMQSLVGMSPAAVFAAALFTAFRFNRDRAFFATLVLALSWYMLREYPGAFTYHPVSLLLPLNLIVFALIRERGIFTRIGSLRFLFVFLQALFVWMMAWSGSEKLLWLVTLPLFESGLTRVLAFAPPAFLAMLVAALLLNGRLFLKPNPERAAFFAAQLTVIGALYDGIDAWWTGLLLGAAGTMFLVAVLQTSWRMAYIDELTGLPGRRALEEQLQRLGDEYVIAMVDVDHFKAFNDRHGHDAGDEVLRMVASRLGEVGSGGRVFRYGGEEFAIVFPGKRMREALAPLGALRKRIDEERFVLRARDRRRDDPADGDGNEDDDGKAVSITISIGVAEANDETETQHEVMRRADRALYRAKEQGRNQVCR